jgi:hypothetical protein
MAEISDKTRRQKVAELITQMTFGELVAFAADLRDVADVSWRTYSDEDFTAIDLAGALHSWAEEQGDEQD